MSDVVWYGITVILFAGNLACLFYSGWQMCGTGAQYSS